MTDRSVTLEDLVAMVDGAMTAERVLRADRALDGILAANSLNGPQCAALATRLLASVLIHASPNLEARLMVAAAIADRAVEFSKLQEVELALAEPMGRA